MAKRIKELLPEKMPALGAVFYSMLPAKIFSPHYKIIASEIDMPPNGVLLDIGTGPGILPIEIAQKFPSAKITGVDLSPKMIEIANRNCRKHKITSALEFRVMDANKLEFADSSFDMIISTGTMHHWKKPLCVLNEIYRCLKSGCQARIYDGYGDASNEDIDKCIKRPLPGFPSNNLVRKILKIHGFSQNEYDTKVNEIISQSRFGGCAFEKHGIMMLLKLRK
jgi:ubiquinone/menaquinone biosynthesis C-methylase UbiE